MTPVRRLALAGAAMIGGGLLVAAGARVTWASVTVRPSGVRAPGLPQVVFETHDVYGGNALGVAYFFGLGLLLALVPLAWLVVGPNARMVLAFLALATAVWVGVATAQVRGDLIPRAERKARSALLRSGDGDVRIASGPGIGITGAGAALATLGAMGGAVVARQVPRMRLPERPPSPPSGHGPDGP